MKLKDLFEKTTCRKRKANAKHDQYYLLPDRLNWFVNWVKQQDFFSSAARKVDPCAGDGAICHYFPDIEMYDLDPRGDNITQQDFLSSTFEHLPNTLVIMNPPFGTKGQLAVDFFNKAAQFADYIAGVFPGSFERDSMKDKLSASHTLVKEVPLPDCSFWLPSEGTGKEPYDVPAVAQIWKRQQRQVKPKRRSSEHFKFVTSPAAADFAVIRSGARSGTVKPATDDLSRGTHYFVKALIDPNIVVRAFQQVNWSDMSRGTGPRYINQPEFVKLVEPIIQSML